MSRWVAFIDTVVCLMVSVGCLVVGVGVIVTQRTYAISVGNTSVTLIDGRWPSVGQILGCLAAAVLSAYFAVKLLYEYRMTRKP